MEKQSYKLSESISKSNPYLFRNNLIDLGSLGHIGTILNSFTICFSNITDITVSAHMMEDD